MIGDLIVDVLWEVILAPLFYTTGRVLVFLFTLGFVRIPPRRRGGVESGLAEFGLIFLGLVFWLGLVALGIYLLLARLQVL